MIWFSSKYRKIVPREWDPDYCTMYVCIMHTLRYLFKIIALLLSNCVSESIIISRKACLRYHSVLTLLAVQSFKVLQIIGVGLPFILFHGTTFGTKAILSRTYYTFFFKRFRSNMCMRLKLCASLAKFLCQILDFTSNTSNYPKSTVSVPNKRHFSRSYYTMFFKVCKFEDL